VYVPARSLTYGRLREIVAANVCRLRESKGWSQKDLIQKAGTKSVSMVETAKRTSLKSMLLCAQALGVPLAALCRVDDAEGIHPAVTKFLESGMAGELDSGELDALFLLLEIPGREPTPESCMLALSAVRAMKKQ